MQKETDACVYNQTRDCFVATELTVADTFVRRLVGLIGQSRNWVRPGRGLWIVPSQGVHTVGMLFPIDVVFLDKKKRVVQIREYVRPFGIAGICLKADSVLELPAHTVFRTGTRIGDVLAILRNDRKEFSPG